MRSAEVAMAGDSYSLEEVSALLAIPVSDLIRKIEEGAFPGRFLTSNWEMRIPVQDVRKAVEAMRRRSSSEQALAVRPNEGASGLDATALRTALESWWEDREARLIGELREILQREDDRWEAVEHVLCEIRDRLTRLEQGSQPSSAWSELGEGWASDIEGAEGPVESILSDLRDLERLLGLDDSGDGTERA